MADISIIGAGLGGLALSMRLASRGHQVTVYEKQQYPGGRCGVAEGGGYRFDTGPTLLLMPDVLDELFEAAGLSLGSYLTLRTLDPNYRIHYRDGSDIVWRPDKEWMAGELERIHPGAGDGFRRFIREAEVHYRTARSHFVERDFDSYLEFLAPGQVAALFRTHAHRNLWRYTRSMLPDDRFCQSVTFQSMYLGTSPFESPAIYTLLPWTEMCEGIGYPEGGLHAVPRAMERAAKDLGVTFHYGVEVTDVDRDGRRVRGIQLDTGDRVETPWLVANEDLPHFLRERLGEDMPPRPWPWRYSAGTFLYFFGLDTQYDCLEHHNVILPGFERIFEDIATRQVVPEEPAFYISDTSGTDPTAAPEGGSAIYVLVPTPHLDARVDWDAERARVRELVLDKMETLGCDSVRNHIVWEGGADPRDFERDLNLEKGSAFGLAHQFTQVSHLRPHNYHRGIDNLFFVGASVRPGTGIPMVVFSSRLTLRRITNALEGKGQRVGWAATRV
jgi:phytoene desaturase